MYVSKEVQDQTVGFLAQSSTGVEQVVPGIREGDSQSWKATMRVLRSGVYTIQSEGGVAIDGEPVLRPPATMTELYLARGAHQVFIARHDGPGDAPPRLSVTLSGTATPPPGTQAAIDGPDPLFFALPSPGGLLFTWQIQGRRQQALVDSAPHRGFEGTFNDGRPWTAQWRGKIRITAPGDYAFRIEAISSGSLTVDDQQVIRTRASGSSTEGRATLEAGWHTIRVDYADQDPYAQLLLTWRPPDEPEFVPIPDDLLQPSLTLP
jgi:hypothetical protein